MGATWNCDLLVDDDSYALVVIECQHNRHFSIDTDTIIGFTSVKFMLDGFYQQRQCYGATAAISLLTLH